ncbi:diguanylate cyclase [Virgibacillus halodenitrificans]|uniref:diguanylate cyclase n=1 Tax=Virgibacillus halodenitrificans TaxID=1482 RepID=UPI00045D12D2|nr:diguanylate cyclase [Virgibacillus halodenitrificans]CDQ37094.1 Diguanylate cyclase DosC [Virgibacillus halodenitrificans]
MMEKLFFYFLENMALIIALMFLGLKAKEVLLQKFEKLFSSFWVYPLFVTILTLIVMYNPLEYEGMKIDLRAVPLFFVAYAGGWRLGILSGIIPLIFRVYLGGPTVLIGIIQTIIMPICFGAFFKHKQKDTHHPILNLSKMMFYFIIFEIIQSVWMYWSTEATALITVSVFVFACIAAWSMGLIFNDVHRSLNMINQLEMLSYQDAMTLLPNIRYFKEKLLKMAEQKDPFAIAMIDVDYFKKYNDTNGHPKGDVVLRTIGKILSDSCVAGDFVARYGGEEFIMCFQKNSLYQVSDITERLRKSVEAYIFEGEETQPGGFLTISIGVSFSKPEKSMEAIIEEADKALYQSKRNGRNRVTIYKEG